MGVFKFTIWVSVATNYLDGTRKQTKKILYYYFCNVYNNIVSDIFYSSLSKRPNLPMHKM